MSKQSDDRILYLLKSSGPQATADIGAALKITTPGAQQHLSRLAGLGLIAPEDRKHGRGRPRRYWHLTEKGHSRFPDRHSDLTLELLETTRAVFGAEGLEKLIGHREQTTLAAYREELDGIETTRGKVEALAAIRTREGYMAEWEEIAQNVYLLAENHCPICAAATVCQGLCRSELQIFQAVLGPQAEVRRVDHILAGARRCSYRIEIRH